MSIDQYTKALLTLIALALVTLTANTLLRPNQTVRAANYNLQFSADKDHFYFYDPNSGKIYTYLVVGGYTQNVLQLSEPGKDLQSTALH